MSKKLFLFSFGIIGCAIISILGFYSASWLFHYVSVRESTNYSIYPNWECLSPPKADLIGTWYAGGPKRSDSLIIREDGTYKQIIHIDHLEMPDYDYESDWQAWRLEYLEEGLLIHLEGMNLCAAYSDLADCEHAGGKDFTWGNFCGNNPTGEGTPGNGDGILIVMRSPALSQPPRGIQLQLMEIQEFPWGYELKEP